MLDSLSFRDKIVIKNIRLADIIDVKHNFDCSYDFKYLEEDIWHGSGWEFGLLMTLKSEKFLPFAPHLLHLVQVNTTKKKV